MMQLYIPAISFFPFILDHDPKYFLELMSLDFTKRTRVTSSLTRIVGNQDFNGFASIFVQT